MRTIVSENMSMIGEENIEYYERQNLEIIEGAPSSEPRQKLSESLPLDTPLAMHLFPVYACNMRCEFCLLAQTEAERGYVSDVKTMPIELFRKIVDDLGSFPRKLKLMRIAGVGEPLLHRDIGEFVRYATESGYIERVEIVTNGSLLRPSLSDELIRAGLSKLRVSVEGLSAEDYYAHAKVKIDFDAFVRNLAYYYEHRGASKLYIKILDYMLKGAVDAERFIDIFRPVADAIQIEHLTPVVKGLDFTQMMSPERLSSRQTGGRSDDVNICALPYYMLQVNPDGKVFPCPSFRVPAPLGDMRSESLSSIWSGDVRSRFLLKMLEGAVDMEGVCSDCNYYKYIMQDEDVLDGNTSELRRRYEAIRYE